jgi:drug/metabolite transporter (DMT)-like permease
VKATAITYVNPGVAVPAGVLILDERVTVWTVVTFVLVLCGSILVTGQPPERLATRVLKPMVRVWVASGGAASSTPDPCRRGCSTVGSTRSPGSGR